MIYRSLKIAILFVLVGLAVPAGGQTFTFECRCEHVTGTDCDICTNTLVSRSFHGLLIKRNGVPYRWIDEPYTIRQQIGETVLFIEQIPNPDQINIARFQTQFSTMAGFLDSTTCFCNLGGAMDTVVVDTPLIGNGTIGNPLTIGQFGADTNSVLKWNGNHWFPAHLTFEDLLLDLPYFTGDSAAQAAGLMPGDPYLLECDNDYGLVAGLFKVVKLCDFDCSFVLHFYPNDPVAMASGVQIGREYALDEGNLFGILYGFLKVVTNDTLAGGTLVCSFALPNYANDAAAIVGGLALGDHYVMSVANSYGSPSGMHRAVSNSGSTMADADPCCDLDDHLPFYPNNAAAITGGLAAGDSYYLTADNTVGWPYGTKRKIL